MLSTATIAFVTVLATMGGLYFNLEEKTSLPIILIFEIVFIIAVLLFIKWIHRRGERDG